MRLRSWIIRFGPAVLVMVLIFIASATPSSQLPNAGSWDTLFKKGGHMTGYALLALSLVRAQKLHLPRNFLIALAGCLVYALSDEFHQSFTPGRNATLVDVGIDLAGAVVGLALLSRWRALKKWVLL